MIEIYTNRTIYIQLKNQIDGKQPYGIYIDNLKSWEGWFLEEKDFEKKIN